MAELPSDLVPYVYSFLVGTQERSQGGEMKVKLGYDR